MDFWSTIRNIVIQQHAMQHVISTNLNKAPRKTSAGKWWEGISNGAKLAGHGNEWVNDNYTGPTQRAHQHNIWNYVNIGAVKPILHHYQPLNSCTDNNLPLTYELKQEIWQFLKSRYKENNPSHLLNLATFLDLR